MNNGDNGHENMHEASSTASTCGMPTQVKKKTQLVIMPPHRVFDAWLKSVEGLRLYAPVLEAPGLQHSR